LNLECDELWSFVDHKETSSGLVGNGPKTREIVGVYIGEQKPEEAKTCGILYLLYIDNVLSVIQIFGSRACILPRHKE